MELLDSIATDIATNFSAMAAAIRVEPIVLAALLQLLAFALAMAVSRLRAFWADPEDDEPDDLAPAAALVGSFGSEELALMPLSAISTCAQVRQWIELHPTVEVKSLPSSQLALW